MWHSSHLSILSSTDSPYWTSPLHHQASQNIIAAPHSHKAKAFCPWRSLPASLRGWPGIPTRGRMVGQADRGLWTFFYQIVSCKTETVNSALVQIFFILDWNPHRWIEIPQGLGGIRRIDPVILFFGGGVVVVLINCYWGIVAFQCCVSGYCTAKWVCHMYTHPSLGIFFPLGHHRALSRPPCRLHWLTERSVLCGQALRFEFCVDRHLGLSFVWTGT